MTCLLTFFRLHSMPFDNQEIQSKIKALLTYFAIVICSPIAISQIDCELNNVTARITAIEGATIVTGSSTIESSNHNGIPTFGSPMEIVALSCGNIVLEITLNYEWIQGEEDFAWIHGISFNASDGWSSAEVGDLDEGWGYYDSVTGDCSGNTYTDGFFYDNCNFFYIDESSCSCFDIFNGPIECNICDSPEDNWGIDCELNECPEFTFRLTFCPSVAGNTTEDISFFITNDGESGSWDRAIGCFYLVNYPIQINSAGIPINESELGPGCPGSCYSLDVGMGCEGFNWSTGETTQQIEVCPTISTDYQVTVSSCGQDLVGTFPVQVMSCDQTPNAGTITISNTDCPSTIIDVSIEDATTVMPYRNISFVTDENNFIIDIIENEVWSSPGCGIFQIYNYNFIENSQNVLSPIIGMNVSDLSLDSDCCDLSEAVNLNLDDSELPQFLDIPSDLTFDCFIDIPLIPELDWFDNCSIGGTVNGILASNANYCDGGEAFITWSIQDDCGNTNSHTQNITYLPGNPIELSIDIPAELTLDCVEDLDNSNLLFYTNNGLSNDCLLEGEIESVDIVPLNCSSEPIIRTWTVIDPCDQVIEFSQNVWLTQPTDISFTSALPQDVTLSCFNLLPEMEFLTYSNNEDGNCLLEGTIMGTQISSNDDCNIDFVTRIWEVDIPCGNVLSHTQIITLTKDSIETVVVEFTFYVPTVFDPTHDGPNNQFTIYSDQIESITDLSIYDRWGSLIFSQSNFPPNDITYGWDGTHNGTLFNSGVFVYAVSVRLLDGSMKELFGNVTIVR